MNKTIAFLSLTAACMVTLFHCAGLSIERKVQDNLFTSSHGPNIAIKIHPDLQYMGTFEATHSIATTFGQSEGRKVPVRFLGYLFCEMGDNHIIEKMCSINFSEILDQNTVQPNAPLKGADYDMKPGTLKMEEDTTPYLYKNVVNPFSHEMNTFIYNAGITKDLLTAKCYLLKRMIRMVSEDSKILMTVDYAEDVEDAGMCHEWNQPVALLTDTQQRRLREFLRDSNENIHILKNEGKKSRKRESNTSL